MIIQIDIFDNLKLPQENTKLKITNFVFFAWF